MTTYSFAQLREAAQEAGLGGSLISDGTGVDLIVSKTNVSQTQGKPPKDTIGLLIKVASGPQAGESTWMNQTISPESPQAMAVFFRIMGDFGLDASYFATVQPGVDGAKQIAARLEGLRFTADVGKRTWGKNKDRTDNTFSHIKMASVLAAAAPAPAAPEVPSAPAAPAPPF